MEKKMKSNGHKECFQKLLDEGGSKESYGGGMSHGSGTRAADETKSEGKWQGTTKGKTKHTFKA